MPVSRKAKMIVAGGFNTQYFELGDSANPKLVLVHDGGFGTMAEACWSNSFDLLAKDFHVFAPDLLGWGGSDKVVYLDRSPYAGRIPHIEAFVKAVGIERAFYAGASFGGSLIMRAAVTPGNPWNIERAISIAGPGGPFRVLSAFEALSQYVPSMEAARKVTEMVVGPAVGLEDHIRLRHEAGLIPGHWECVAAAGLKNPSLQQSAPDDPYLNQLRDLAIPTLLIAGRHDPLLEPGWASKLAELSDLISAVELDTAHLPNVTEPELTAGLMRDFFLAGKVA